MKGVCRMFSISQDDVLRALKKSRRIAKQDVLASVNTADPPFWRSQAEARRAVYDLLAADVAEHGVEVAYQSAARAYAALPLIHLEPNNPADPVVLGKEKAYEVFFTIIGLPAKQLAHLRNARRRNSPRRAPARRGAAPGVLKAVVESRRLQDA